MNLADISTVKKLLQREDFSFKKSLGQNFLVDASVCPAMAAAAADKNTGVIEIGPGIGVLTVQLCEIAKRVVAIELDERLKNILAVTLADCGNVEVVFADAMKIDLAALIKEKFADCKKVCVCANLPYYITSPVIMHLLESRLPLDNITVMVQDEAADRICATVGRREAGAVTAAVDYFAQAQKLFTVGAECFVPPPKVKSAVIKLRIRKTPKVTPLNEEFFFKFVRACFAQRRKTLLNTVSNTLHIEKSVLRKALAEASLPENTRGETLDMQTLCRLADSVYREKQG